MQYFWDQDILNVIIDDNFLELPESLNSRNREIKSSKTGIPSLFWEIQTMEYKWSKTDIRRKFS